MNPRIVQPTGKPPAIHLGAGTPIVGYAAMIVLLIVALFGKSALASGDFSAASGGGNLVNQVAFIGALALAVAGVQPWKTPARLLVLPVTLALALFWAWLSVGWSLAPAISIRRVALLTVATMTAFLAVRQLGADRAMAIIRIALIAALAGSIAVAVLLPSVGVQYMSVLTERTYGGTWRGLFIDKNMCGQFCMIVTLFFVFGRFPAHQRFAYMHYAFRLAVVLLAVFLLYKTQSKTSMGVLAFALIFGFLARYVRRLRYLLIPLVGYFAVIAIFYSDVMFAPFAQALDDPEAFTGRGAIWSALVVYIQNHWLLGTGYGAFWAVGDVSPIYQTAGYEWVKQVLTGHNGYLDTWAQIGLPGLLLVITATFIVPLIKVLSAHIDGQDVALLSSLLIGFAGISITESVLFNTDMLSNVFHMITLALIYTMVPQRRRTQGGT